MNELLDRKMRYRAAVARAQAQVINGRSATMMVKESPAYSGRALQLLPIVFVNLVLTLLTVGMYRFWAKTRIRKYFLSRIAFLGDPLEYTGTGAELFKGFMIVLVIMVPFLFVTGLVQQFVAAPGASAVNAAVYQAAYLLAIYFLYSVAVYRAQRYRLSRTIWRGIRAGQEGSALLYALFALGLGLLTLVTAGLAYPVMRRYLVGYRIDHACFGTERFHYGGGFGRLLIAWLVPWLIFAAMLGLFGYIAWEKDLAQLAETPPDLVPGVLASLPSQKLYVALGLLLLLPIAMIWYRAFEARQWINNTQFGELAFASRVRVYHILFPYLAYWIVLLLVSIAIFAGLGFAFRSYFDPRQADAVRDFAPLIAIGALFAIWMIAGVLQPMIVQNRLIRSICRTLTLQGTFSPDRLFQSQLNLPQRGEGLADALDVDAF
jgi:uncharacterized membrane protein YjgN (DUF898 family)